LADVSPLTSSEYSLNNITWNTWSSPYSLGSIASGSSNTVYIKGTVPSDVTSISNTATVSSDIYDPDESNNSATDVTTVLGADLTITKTDNKTEVDAGVEDTYAIQIVNNGPGTATNVVLTDSALDLTGAIQYRIGSGAWIDWPVSNTVNFGTIGSAGVRNVFIKGTVPSDVTSISNTASVSSDTFDPNMSNNSATDVTTVRYGSISGVLWDDLNQNGIQDLGELPLTGWTVWIDPILQTGSAGVLSVPDARLGISSGHFMTYITDLNGHYEFNMLPPGDYILGVDAPLGWTSTFPPGFTVNVSVLGGQSVNPALIYGFGGALIPALPYTGR
jgi:hypothetical protein